MFGPAYYEIRLTTTWNGQTVYVQQAVSAELWAYRPARQSIKEHLLNNLGIEIAKRLDVEMTAGPVTPWE